MSDVDVDEAPEEHDDVDDEIGVEDAADDAADVGEDEADDAADEAAGEDVMDGNAGADDGAEGPDGGESGARSGSAASKLPPAPEEIVPINVRPIEMLKAHLRIGSAFKIFDHDGNNQVDARELGTIIRALGCCPTEQDVNDIILECEEDDQPGIIKYERFEPVMTRVLLDKRFLPVTDELILRAFQTLDTAGTGTLSDELVEKFFAKDGKGEPFTQAELDELMAAARDPDTGLVHYTEHALLMALDPELLDY